MRADLRAFFHHDDREIGIELLEADRGREAGGARADDHHVEIHALARGAERLCQIHRHDLPALRPAIRSFSYGPPPGCPQAGRTDGSGADSRSFALGDSHLRPQAVKWWTWSHP